MKYAAARTEIENGDVLAFRGRGFVSRMISLFSGGSTTHVGMAVWWHNRLMLLESREFRGIRIVALSREVERNEVWWYRPSDEATLLSLHRLRKMAWAVENAGTGYNYLGILRYTYRVVPKWLRWLLPKTQTDRLSMGNRFCSEFVSAVYRRAGLDLRPDLPDASTSPAELVKTTLLENEGRLRT